MMGKKLLIVDDDPHLVLGLSARLKANGYRVFSAPDAISAISMTRKETPDLVILDLGLPGGDGFIVLERMKGLTATEQAPTIVLSAREPVENKRRALDAGAVAFLQKPTNNHELLSAVRLALGEKAALSSFLAT
jgi:DNA-binding response OmpR family regulator